MTFTEKETSILRQWLHEAAPAAKILIQGKDAVSVFGGTQISLIDFREPLKVWSVPVNLSVQWDECARTVAHAKSCIYNITVVHKSQEANHVFVCGTNGKETACCNMNISEHSARCSPSDKVNNINMRIRDFNLKEEEASAFVESPESTDLYVTNSGSQDSIGIHRFGKHGVRPPAYHHKEQHYVELIASKQDRINGVPQDKIYGFYNEKNTDTDMYGHMWKPYVTQICMTDIGGPKNNLQFTWTSQLNARLFCGDIEQKQHFSELLDITTVQADHWQETRVYGLFQNEWGMRAVCVYKIQDIDDLFKTSSFKNSTNQPERPRKCVADSTKLGFETLKQIGANCEMEKCIQPVNTSGPLLISYHHYNLISVHDFLDSRNTIQTIMFLSLRSGAVHKVKHKQSSSEAKAFIIAEYKPFNHKTHIVSMALNPTTKKLYVTSRTEVAQLDVANCHHYGDGCEECVLARDPYCGWSQGQCAQNGSLQDTENGNPAICSSSTSNLQRKVRRRVAGKESDDTKSLITVPRGSRFFLECPVSSLHAQYSWYHDNSPMPCSGAQEQCLLLMASTQPEQQGTYTCECEEQGYRRQLAQYELRVEDGAQGYCPGLVLWIGLTAALLV